MYCSELLLIVDYAHNFTSVNQQAHARTHIQTHTSFHIMFVFSLSIAFYEIECPTNDSLCFSLKGVWCHTINCSMHSLAINTYHNKPPAFIFKKAWSIKSYLNIIYTKGVSNMDTPRRQNIGHEEQNTAFSSHHKPSQTFLHIVFVTIFYWPTVLSIIYIKN